MATLIQFKDYASTTLSSPITAAATSISVLNASVLPTLSGGGQYFYATFADFASGGANNREVVKVTAVVGNVLTVVRGITGAPSIFNAGDLCDNRVCAQAMIDIAALASGAPASSSYVTAVTEGVLTGSRHLANTATINFIDAGAGSTMSFGVNAASITSAMMSNFNANSILGNNTGAPAVPTYLTVAQTVTMLAATTFFGTGVTQASWGYGTHANRPAFGTIGRFYFETDTLATFYDSGAAWVVWSDAAGYLLASNNLSDLTNAATARTNLGLGTAAVQNSGFFLQAANNLADVSSATSSLNNLSYLNPATGAVARGVNPKLTDWQSAIDFGVTGNGVTNDAAAFILAYAGVGAYQEILLPGNKTYLVSSAVTQTGNSVWWHAEGGITLTQTSIQNLLQGRTGPADTLVVSQSQMWSMGGSTAGTSAVAIGNEFGKYVGWRVNPTTSGGAIAYEKDALMVAAVTNDAEILGTDTKFVCGLNARGYIAATNSQGRVFGANIYGIISAGGEGACTGLEINLSHNASVVKDYFTGGNVKTGLIFANQGAAAATAAIVMGIGAGGQGFYQGIEATQSAFYNADAASRFIKLINLFAVYPNGETTIGKDTINQQSNGIELDPTGNINVSSATAANLNLYRTGIMAAANEPGVITAWGENSGGTLKSWTQIFSEVIIATAGLEVGVLSIEALDPSGLSLYFTIGNGAYVFNKLGAVVQGDFSNATQTSRTFLQSSTTNGNSTVGVLPNGSAVIAGFRGYNNATPTNAAFIGIQSSSTAAQLISGVVGSGTQLPLEFRINNLLSGSFDTSGNLINNLARADQSYSYQTPITGFTITLGNTSSTLILDPAGTLATGTITMPATPIDGQRIRVSSTQIVTTLTTSPNSGQSIKNAPTTLAAGIGFQYIYRLANTTWYRQY